LFDLRCTRLALKIAAFFYRAAVISLACHSRAQDAIVVGKIRGMWDVLWNWVFASYGSDASIRSLSSFGESIVAGVEIFTFLNTKY
jgi:hypothetical protein